MTQPGGVEWSSARVGEAIECDNHSCYYRCTVSTYRLRKPFVLLEAFLVPSVGAVLLLLTVRPLKLALAAVLVLLAIGAWGLVRVSRRSLTVTDEGMQLQRDKYRLTAPWDAVEAVHRGRRRGLVKADELILADSWIVAIDHAGRTTALPKGVEGHPAPRRVQVSLYERDWPSGPIGQHLRARGITI